VPVLVLLGLLEDVVEDFVRFPKKIQKIRVGIPTECKFLRKT
jgi:hypothetical protein